MSHDTKAQGDWYYLRYLRHLRFHSDPFDPDPL